ncbi:MAG: hypothetical protein HY951_06440 [Bacteroidia bacterium]|nr:hypothetical protein [Bacteroidia bacterium]
MIKNIIISILVLLNTSVFSLNTSEKTDAVNCLKKAYAQWNSLLKEQKETAICIKYSVTIKYMQENAEKTTNSTVEFYSKNDKSVILNSDMQYYGDNALWMVIQPIEKRITLYDPDNNKLNQRKSIQPSAIQDSIFKVSTVISDKKEKTGNKEIRKIRIRLNEKGIKSFGFTTVDYIIDCTTNQIKALKMYFAPSSKQMRSLELKVNEINNKYSGQVLTNNFYSKVFQPNGKLRSDYSKYQVKDFRKSKKL